MKKINYILSGIFIGLDLVYLVKYLMTGQITRILIAIITPVIILLPYLIKKIYKMNDKLTCIYIILVFFFLELGSLLNGYSRIPNYDSYSHFIFGFMSGIISLIILKLCKKDNSVGFNIMFIILMSLGLSALWEIWEFADSKIFNEDVQHVLTNGVTDTM